MIVQTSHARDGSESVPVYIVDQVGLFSQNEHKELARQWKKFQSQKKLNFGVAVVSDDVGDHIDSIEAATGVKLADSVRSVVFYLAHESREIRIYRTPDLDSAIAAIENDVIEDALISNFEKGWWKYGFEEGSKAIAREINQDRSGGLKLSSATWYWLVFGLALVVLILAAKRKNATTITSSKINRRNILRTSPKEEKKNPDERKFFDGAGAGGSFGPL